MNSRYFIFVFYITGTNIRSSLLTTVNSRFTSTRRLVATPDFPASLRAGSAGDEDKEVERALEWLIDPVQDIAEYSQESVFRLTVVE